MRKESGIPKLLQVAGRTSFLAAEGRDDELRRAPVPADAAGMKEEDFRTEFAVNPPNALLALYNKQADAAGGGDILIDLPVVRNAIKTQELVTLAVTEPLLFLPWAVKRTMPTKLAESIQAILVELDAADAGRKVLKSARTTGIERAGDKDYDPHRRMIHAVFGPDDIQIK